MEADDVVGQQPAVDLLADAARAARARRRAASTGCGRSGAGRRPGARGGRAPAACTGGSRGPSRPARRGPRSPRRRRVGEVLVDDVVAVLERLDLVAADVRRVGEVPEVVLDEPQHRVGEDVVEAVVGLGVARRRAAPGTRRPPASATANGLAAVLARPAARRRRSSPSAIQTASRCEARPVSAVTSPPVPRLTRAVVLEGHRARGWRPGREGARSRHGPTLLQQLA